MTCHWMNLLILERSSTRPTRAPSLCTAERRRELAILSSWAPARLSRLARVAASCPAVWGCGTGSSAAWDLGDPGPDGQRIVTASRDRTARIWNAATGEPIGEPMEHESWV